MKAMQPIQLIDQEYLSVLLKKAGYPFAGVLLEGVSEVKLFYNSVYSCAIDEIDRILEQENAAGVMRRAYLELIKWNIVYYAKREGRDNYGCEAPFELAPYARYGWQYVIERAFRFGAMTSSLHYRPKKTILVRLFNLLVVALQCSEVSNTIHFFSDSDDFFQVEIDPRALLKSPNANPSFVGKVKSLQEYVFEHSDIDSIRNINDFNKEEIDEQIDNYLVECHHFDLNDISIVTTCLMDIASRLEAGTIIHSYSYLVYLVTNLSSLSNVIVENVFDFLLLSKEKLSDERNFLTKSQNCRMINYAGIIVENSDISCLRSIYDLKAAKSALVKEAGRHVIISPLLLSEWLDVFHHRICYGKRRDLKDKACGKKYITEIEDYIHKNYFEEYVKDVFDQFEIETISGVKKNASGKALECGEIDLIGYSNGCLYLVEVKGFAPLVDLRDMHQNYLDHFKQKKYHKKFLRKCVWVEENLDEVEKIFGQYGCDIGNVSSVEKVFVTINPGAAKIFVYEYLVLTASELKQWLWSK